MANTIAINENYHTHDAEIFTAFASSFWALGDYDKALTQLENSHAQTLLTQPVTTMFLLLGHYL